MEAWRAQMQARAFKGLDSDGSGGVSLAEFQAGLQNLPTGRAGPAANAGAATQASLEGAFRSVDTDGDGTLSAAELGAALKARGRGGHHRHAEAAGSAFAAQLLGQDQAAPGAIAGEQARHLLLRYAFAQGAGGGQAGLSA
jgi:Ca2+-binding EF-hand superfamily protein